MANTSQITWTKAASAINAERYSSGARVEKLVRAWNSPNTTICTGEKNSAARSTAVDDGLTASAASAMMLAIPIETQTELARSCSPNCRQRSSNRNDGIALIRTRVVAPPESYSAWM